MYAPSAECNFEGHSNQSAHGIIDFFVKIDCWAFSHCEKLSCLVVFIMASDAKRAKRSENWSQADKTRLIELYFEKFECAGSNPRTPRKLYSNMRPVDDAAYPGESRDFVKFRFRSVNIAFTKHWSILCLIESVDSFVARSNPTGPLGSKLSWIFQNFHEHRDETVHTLDETEYRIKGCSVQNLYLPLFHNYKTSTIDCSEFVYLWNATNSDECWISAVTTRWMA